MKSIARRLGRLESALAPQARPCGVSSSWGDRAHVLYERRRRRAEAESKDPFTGAAGLVNHPGCRDRRIFAPGTYHVNRGMRVVGYMKAIWSFVKPFSVCLVAVGVSSDIAADLIGEFARLGQSALGCWDAAKLLSEIEALAARAPCIQVPAACSAL